MQWYSLAAKESPIGSNQVWHIWDIGLLPKTSKVFNINFHLDKVIIHAVFWYMHKRLVCRAYLDCNWLSFPIMDHQAYEKHCPTPEDHFVVYKWNAGKWESSTFFISRLLLIIVVLVQAWICNTVNFYVQNSKDHGANMGPTWVLSAPDGPHVGPMNLAIWGVMSSSQFCLVRWL